ncbi:hypothetical protein SAMN05216228_1008109 [Rhizobium tibeticum]|uniref:Uncharacterized protein n=1 Tax=Rhizobium tibeticum TaxID=501024 RepID=A0A1H8JYY2_9HYPH|nr:hypothetical protein RTCCBAU85039_2349 [Rhizobium tibeticum]SEN85751.1 hypothetical protein SAMN05216228_1008109 [Rhizobium tibeticum]
MKKWLARTLGFVVAVVLCYLLAFLFFAVLNDVTGKHYMPRGAGWLFAPLAVGIAGAKLAEGALPSLPMRIASPSQTLKYYLAGAVLWMAAVLCWVFIFDPFGSYWSSADWAFLWKLILTPVAFASLCGAVIHWLRPRPR